MKSISCFNCDYFKQRSMIESNEQKGLCILYNNITDQNSVCHNVRITDGDIKYTITVNKIDKDINKFRQLLLDAYFNNTKQPGKEEYEQVLFEEFDNDQNKDTEYVLTGYDLSYLIENKWDVQFSFENTYMSNDPYKEYCKQYCGIFKIEDTPCLGFIAGGDWEQPIYGIIYSLNDKLYGYIPEQGNYFNTKHMSAFGNNPEDDETYPQYTNDYDQVNFDFSRILFDIKRKLCI